MVSVKVTYPPTPHNTGVRTSSRRRVWGKPWNQTRWVWGGFRCPKGGVVEAALSLSEGGKDEGGRRVGMYWC